MCTPLISIIVPVYKAEPYLLQCVNSLLNQTYQNLEIILVDDGGTDNCPTLCDQFSRNDSRVISIHIANSGVSAARNIGLSYSHGDYIMFLDSDDWMDAEACQSAIDSSLKYDADVVFWPFCCEYSDDGSNSVQKSLFLNADHYFDENESRDLFRLFIGPFGQYLNKPYLQDRLSTVWGKLYRAEIIKDNTILFEDITQIGSEDTLFNIQVFSYVHRAVYLNHFWTHYRKTNSGTLTAAYKPDLAARFFRLFDHIRIYLTNRNEDTTFYNALNNRIVLSLIGLGQNEVRSQTGIKKSISAIRSIITNKIYLEAIASFPIHDLPLWGRVFFTLAKMKAATALCIGLKLTQFIRNVLHR